MKFANTVIALVLLAALGGVLFYLNKHPKTETPSDSSIPKKKLFSFQPDQVKSFSMEAPGQPAATIRKAGNQKWEIASPAGVLADSSSVQSFVDGLPKMEYTPLDSPQSSLAEYGLDQPQKTWKFELASGQPVTLLIGKENPGGYAKYAMFASTPGLFLLDSMDTKDLVEKTLFDLRDKRVLPIAMDKAKQVQLKFELKPTSAAELEKAKKLGLSVKPPKIVLTRQPNNNWEVTDPAVRTDYGDTNYFVTILNGGIMKSVEAEDAKSLSSYGLDKPAIRVDITAEDGSVHSLLVGSKKEKKAEGEKKEGETKSDENLGYYAKNSDSPAVFTINQSVYDQLNQDLDNYRNRFLFDFDTANARRIELQGPTGELRLDRKGEDWLKGPDAKTKVDASKVSAFLDDIHAMRIQHYTEDKPGHLAEYGLDKPWLKVKITFSEQNKEETVIFGQKNKKFYAARQDSPSVYEMPASEPDTLQTKLKEMS